MSDMEVNEEESSLAERLEPQNILTIEELCNTELLLELIQNKQGIFAIRFPDPFTQQYVALVPASMLGSKYMLLAGSLDINSLKHDSLETNIQDMRIERLALSALQSALSSTRNVVGYLRSLETDKAQREYYFSLMPFSNPLLKDVPLLSKSENIPQEKKTVLPEIRVLFENMIKAPISYVAHTNYAATKRLSASKVVDISFDNEGIYVFVDEKNNLSSVAVSLGFPDVDTALQKMEIATSRFDGFINKVGLYKHGQLPLIVEKFRKSHSHDPGLSYKFLYLTTVALSQLNFSKDEIGQLARKFQEVSHKDGGKSLINGNKAMKLQEVASLDAVPA